MADRVAFVDRNLDVFRKTGLTGSIANVRTSLNAWTGSAVKEVAAHYGLVATTKKDASLAILGLFTTN